MVFKFYYFDGRGTGEPIRQLFKLADEPFEDIRISQEDWVKKYKPEMPFGQVPVLEADGVKIPQSAAIGRFVARKFGFGGKTPTEQAFVDAYTDLYKDHYNEISDWFYTVLGFKNAGDKAELFKSVYEPARDKFYDLISKRLKANGSGFLVGTSPTFVDLLIADHVRTIELMAPGALNNFPEVLALKDKVENLPPIKKWIETRPPSKF